MPPSSLASSAFASAVTIHCDRSSTALTVCELSRRGNGPANNAESKLALANCGKQGLRVSDYPLLARLVVLATPGDAPRVEIEVLPSQVHDRAAATACCFEKHKPNSARMQVRQRASARARLPRLSTVFASSA